MIVYFLYIKYAGFDIKGRVIYIFMQYTILAHHSIA